MHRKEKGRRVLHVSMCRPILKWPLGLKVLCAPRVNFLRVELKTVWSDGLPLGAALLRRRFFSAA